MSEEEPDDEPWLMDYPSPREEVASTPSQKQPLTPHEADVELQAFRPIKARPEDLEHLLACRADPNKPITKPGGISPLQNVFTFLTGPAGLWQVALQGAPRCQSVRGVLLKG